MDSTGPDQSARELVEQLAEIFAGEDFPAVIIGGMAVNFWVEPRFTKDVDFTIRASANLIEWVTERLLAAGFGITRLQGQDDASGPDFVRFASTGDSPRIVEFQAAKTEYQDLVIDRGYRADDAQPFPVATPEDLVVLKLIANRSHDLVDAIHLALRGGLDWPYIERWCETWQVSDRLSQLREQLAAEEQRIRDLYS